MIGIWGKTLGKLKEMDPWEHDWVPNYGSFLGLTIIEKWENSGIMETELPFCWQNAWDMGSMMGVSNHGIE